MLRSWSVRLVAGFPSRRPGFEPGLGHVRFVVDKAELGNVSPSNFVSPAKLSTDYSTLIIIIIIIIIRGWYDRSFSGLSNNGIGSIPP
jgi:hypothetical protein